LNWIENGGEWKAQDLNSGLRAISQFGNSMQIKGKQQDLSHHCPLRKANTHCDIVTDVHTTA